MDGHEKKVEHGIKPLRAFRSDYVYTHDMAGEIVKNIGRYRIGFTPDFASMESKLLPGGVKAWRVVAYQWPAKHAAK